MLNDFMTMLAGGAFAALTVFALRHAARKLAGLDLPRWLMTAAAGLTMLGVTIYQEYNWFPTVRGGLNDGVKIVLTGEDSSWWRPWTYAAPITTRLMAIDTTKVERQGDIARTEFLLFQRWASVVQAVPVAFDCAAGTRADLIGGTALNADGSLQGGQWISLENGDRGLNIACNGG